ncbi:MAG: ATP-binding protein [Acidobacteriota bacterium]|mgnify:CR=1 FL=1
MAWWRRLGKIRPHDLVLALLFSALAAAGPVRRPSVIAILLTLALLQTLEPRIPLLLHPAGSTVVNLGKLGLAYLVLGLSGGLNSSYYWILLIPVISAGTTLGVVGTAIFTVLACGAYLSYLLRIDWTRYVLPPDQIPEITLRVTFLAVIGYLAQRLAEASRLEARKAEAAAAQLAEANRNLQEAEAAVRRSERLAALGQLSGGLAHELRNPLGTIRASAEMLTRNIGGENAIARELAGIISAEVDRTNSLVTRFLEFARPLELRPARADLGETIDRAIAQLERNSPPYEVTIYKNYSPDLAPFEFDPELMERVIYNLLLNAAQATPAGGAVTVKTRPLHGLAEISVIDRGAGIPPERLESIFNPFVTTKPDGIGLGLAIVSKIVDLHGGRITVESEPEKGSVFRVYLPRSV